VIKVRLEQLHYLVEVYESKSISLGAERAHISQPALSSSISKLEDELGVLLLKRTNQGVYPTEIGEVIIQKAKEILGNVEEIFSVAKNNSIELSGDISIAVEPGFNITAMPNILTTFKYNHPKVNALLKVGESNNILRDVQSGKADFGIILKTEEFCMAKDLSHKELFRDELVILAGRDCPIARKPSVSLDEALSFPMVLYNTEYVTNCGVSSILKKYGNINVSFRVDNLEMMEKILTQGKTIVFVPRFMADEYVKPNETVKINIDNVHLEVSVILIWSNRHHLSTVEKEFIKVIKSISSINVA
jgi:DNA-binding transcriptional LysR family regulator